MYSGFWHMYKHELAPTPLHTLMVIIVFHYSLTPVNSAASRDRNKSRVDKTLPQM